MVPWPVALLSLFYGILATLSAASVWRALIGDSQRSLVWPIVWFAVSASVMCGLPLLKSWARQLAVFSSACLALLMLSAAGLFAMGQQPLGGLLATLGAGVHLVIIRYLRRPVVKAYFTPSG